MISLEFSLCICEFQLSSMIHEESNDHDFKIELMGWVYEKIITSEFF